MIRFKKTRLQWALVLLLVGCSPLSKEVTREAEPPVPYPELVENVDAYKGRTVILGGYIMGVEAVRDELFITVLQTPMNALHEPKDKSLSRGSFVVWHKGPVGSEVYDEGRAVTVAGVVQRLAGEGRFPRCSQPCLLLKSRELFIKPREIRDPMDAVPWQTGSPDVWDTPYPSNWYR